MSDEYDVVIIDSPPCKAVSDSYLLGSMVNYVVLVVKSGVTPVSHVRSVLEKFRDNDVSVAGVILNHVDFESKHNPYYHSYGKYEAYGAEDQAVSLNSTSEA